MATALARGWVQSGWLASEKVTGTDVLPAAREQFTKATACRTVETVAEVLTQAEVIVLAVKPQHMGGVLAEMRGLVEEKHLIVSIAAGVPLAALSETLGQAAGWCGSCPIHPL